MKSNIEIHILPIVGLTLGYMYYSLDQEDWYVEDEHLNEWYCHHTFFLFIFAIRILKHK